MKKITLFGTIFLFLLQPPSAKSQTQSHVQIREVYNNFEIAVKDKNVELLKSTFVSPKTQLNAFIRIPIC